MFRPIRCLAAVGLQLSLGLVPAAFLLAQAPSTPGWSPELSIRYRAIQSTALSPAADLVAYVVREALTEGEKSEYLSQIWIAATDGSWQRQFTRGDKSATSPAFSPDGRWLAFLSSRSGTAQIWAIPLAGGEAEQLTSGESGVSRFQWSPGGDKLAYTMPDPETAEQKQAKREKRDVQVMDTDFRYAHLYVISFEPGPDDKRVAERLTGGAFHVTDFDWAPGGDRLVFAHQPDPRVNTARRDGDLAVVAVADSKMTPLLTEGGVHSEPHYSPDGKTIAFVSTGNQPEPVGLGDIYLIAAEGGKPRKLADTPDRSATILEWSRDGRLVYFTESVRTKRHLLALPVDGGAPEFITRGEGVFSSVSLSDNRAHLAFTFETTDAPPDVHVSPLDRFAMRKVSDLHRSVPKPPMGKSEVLTWRSQDGSYEIDGILTYPVDYQPGRRYPLLLNVHGGPAGVFVENFTGSPGAYMVQTFAQHGYAVLRPNPRGSTGYGRDFRYANVRDWGYGDMDDLMAGVDQVINMGLAHPDSLVLAGWSYGGYMTSFAVTRTDRFKAASMGAGLPNLVSMTTTTDIPDYLVGHMGDEFWNDMATFQKHSAIYRIAEVSTPTQVIHGERDQRVPFTQGQEFYVALQRRGIPTEMIVLPRTPHGPQEPKLLMAVTTRVLQWFDKHLGRTSRQLVP